MAKDKYLKASERERNKLYESLNVKQRLAVELLSSGVLTNVEIAKACEVAPSTITQWQKLPGFIDAVLFECRQNIRAHLPAIYAKLTDKSVEGSIGHMKLLLEHLDRIEEKMSSNATTITFTWGTEEEDDEDEGH